MPALVISDLVGAPSARPAEDKLSEPELVTNTYLLLTAGYETTASLLSNALLTLEHHPDQLEAMRAEPGVIPSAVEEMLRSIRIAEAVLGRVATQEVELSLAFGSGIHHCLGASLARLELCIAFEALLRRLPGLRPAVPASEVEWKHGVLTRAPVALPVKW